MTRPHHATFPQPRVCHYCHRPKGTACYRVIDADGHTVSLYAHLKCINFARRLESTAGRQIKKAR